jgi:hypothetical protein
MNASVWAQIFALYLNAASNPGDGSLRKITAREAVLQMSVAPLCSSVWQPSTVIWRTTYVGSRDVFACLV